MFIKSTIATLAALAGLSQASPLVERQQTCPNGLQQVFVSTNVVSYPVVINQFFNENTVINVGGVTININNAPTSVSTTVTATSTTTTTATVTVGVSTLPTPFILQINQVATRKRAGSLVGLFVAQDGTATTDCTLAAVFSLTNGQLFNNGVPVSTNPGVRSMLLTASSTIETITGTFSSVNGALTWTNAAFFSGSVSFCLSSSGLLARFQEDTVDVCATASLAIVAAASCQSVSSSSSAMSSTSSTMSSSSMTASSTSSSSTDTMSSSSSMTSSSTSSSSTDTMSSSSMTSSSTSSSSTDSSTASSTSTASPSSTMTMSTTSMSSTSTTVPSSTSSTSMSTSSVCPQASAVPSAQALVDGLNATTLLDSLPLNALSNQTAINQVGVLTPIIAAVDVLAVCDILDPVATALQQCLSGVDLTDIAATFGFVACLINSISVGTTLAGVEGVLSALVSTVDQVTTITGATTTTVGDLLDPNSTLGGTVATVTDLAGPATTTTATLANELGTIVNGGTGALTGGVSLRRKAMGSQNMPLPRDRSLD